MKPRLPIIAVLALSGCADQMLSSDHIRESTARALNQPVSAVTISDRQSDGPMNTTYVASTPRGSYHCTVIVIDMHLAQARRSSSSCSGRRFDLATDAGKELPQLTVQVLT